MNLRRAAEDALLEELTAAAEGRLRRSRTAGGAALLKPIAKRLGASQGELQEKLADRAPLALREVEATRLFGLFRKTQPALGVALRSPGEVVRALEGGAAAPANPAFAAFCVAALSAADDDQEPPAFDAVWPERVGAARSLEPLAMGGARRQAAGSEAAGTETARAKSLLARLRRMGPGGGFELGARARVNSPMAALEALLQAPPDALGRVLANEEFEGWLRDLCKERELADLVTATRLRAAAERMAPPEAKRLFVRLLSFSPLRDAAAMGVVPAFVGRLTSAPREEVVEIVGALEGLGTEAVLESLVQAVYEVAPEARPRVLMAMGAVGSPRVLDPLLRLALHSTVKSDRIEAASAVLQIAARHGGKAAEAAVDDLRKTEDPEVRAMFGAPRP